ncbi:MAG: YggS family pyridoxal phosphate-dependent enzyme [Erysipelotrichales bacterium]
MKKQLEQVLADIEAYKTVDEVMLVGVSKHQSVEDIKKLVDLGVSQLGENRPQELRDKYDTEEIDANWHMIGRLQSNKIKYVINRSVLIHSIADIELMKKVNDAALKNDKVMEILFQINPSNEESKQGFSEEELVEALEIAKTLDNIKVVGLMSMAPLDQDDPKVADETFKEAKQIYDKYKNDDFKYLSMGMSSDYKIALKHGANIIRVGSYLFEED